MRILLFISTLCIGAALYCQVAHPFAGTDGLTWFAAAFAAYLFSVAFDPLTDQPLRLPARRARVAKAAPDEPPADAGQVATGGLLSLALLVLVIVVIVVILVR